MSAAATPPARLYKYRSFNVNLLRLITDAEAYYSDPRQFNDPLDCNPTIEVDTDRAALESLWHRLMQSAGFTADKITEEFETLRYWASEPWDGEEVTDVEANLTSSLAAKVKELFAGEMAKHGVLSLSEIWNSPLMWSHYADEHRGLCLEFDTTALTHPRLGAVNYRSSRSVKVSDLINWKLYDSAEAGARVRDTYFFAKAEQWEYEREWRDTWEASGAISTSYPITAIYFGLRCNPAVITSLVKLLSDEKEIEFFRIYPLDDSFGLERRSLERDEIEQFAVRKPAFLDFKDIVIRTPPAS